MAETVRSISDILLLLADNTSGAISPQDLRDAIVSVCGNHGELIGAGTVTGASSFKKFDQWTSGSGGGCVAADHATNRRLTVSVAGVYDASYWVAGYVATSLSNIRVAARLAVNGTTVANTEGSEPTATNQPTALAFRGLLTLAPGDYVEAWIQSGTGSFVCAGARLVLNKVG